MKLSEVLAVSISSMALVVSVLAVYLNTVRRSRLRFAEPGVHALQYSREVETIPISSELLLVPSDAVSQVRVGELTPFLLLPLNITNPGARARRVDFALVTLRHRDSEWRCELYMQVEVDAIPPTKPPLAATGFVVPPNSSVCRLVTFAPVAKEPDGFPVGVHDFELRAVVDGGRLPRKPDLMFRLEITQHLVEMLRGYDCVLD
ncbi:MAG: hypothetical protein HOV94_20570, partial [Saccharothrix sp.]|nr:hypothetical protein [Saccharothrix sp.]